MRKHLKKVLHRTQKSAEAGLSSAAPSRDETATTMTGASRDASYVSNITYNQEAVSEAIGNSKWRKAFFIDGELRWATREGNGIGEAVSTGQTWKMRQIGDVLYLAPKEAHESKEDDVEAANDKRVDAFLDKVARKMVAQSTKVPPPTYEELRPFLSENLDAILQLFTRDGVIATDAHGYIDNDFDNSGPQLNKETQSITRGYHSLMNRDKDPVFERLGNQLAQTVMHHTSVGDDKEPGYESGGSEVSLDRCRESPAYPMCEDSCWLKQASSIPSPASQSSNKPTQITTLQPIDIYTELEPGLTRVLVIEPGTHDEQIRCMLETIEIMGVREQGESTPVERRLYEALSYTWGDATKCQTIQCNGKNFGVGQNLFDALINMRLSDKSRTIWIDALCI
jgi:hypothetical protein